jgi:2-polyprenyl-6-methoxyphenol hydroxylase-like FAD-dependent oxidoreductase
VAAAFHEYEAARVRRANDVVRRSRSVGDIGQLTGSVTRFIRDTAMRLTPESIVKKQMRALMTFSTP